LAELGFTSLAAKGRALMIDANLPLPLWYRLYCMAFRTACALDWLVPIQLDGKLATRWNHFTKGTEPAFARHLRTWGEAGIVKLKNASTGKLADRGTTCMFVGYCLDHGGDTYLMWDPDTYDFHESRDVIWLRRMFFTKKVVESPNDIVVVLEPPTYLDGASDSEDDNDAEALTYDATDFALDAPAFAAAAADERGLFDSSDDEAGESVRSFVNRQYEDWGQGHESDFNGSDKPSENGSDDEDEVSVEPSGNGASVIEEVSETESEAEETKEEDRGVVTRSGRVSKPPARFRETGLFMSRSDDLMKDLREVQELSMMNIDIPKGDELTRAEEAFFDGILELRDASLDNVRKSQIHDPTEVGGVTPLEAAFVGMGIGGGFGTTQELHVLDYKQAVLSRDRREWEEAINEEHQRMMQHDVFVAVPKPSVPLGNRVIDTTWAMKLKANGVRRA
jgi:hypothetical protein